MGRAETTLDEIAALAESIKNCLAVAYDLAQEEGEEGRLRIASILHLLVNTSNDLVTQISELESLIDQECEREEKAPGTLAGYSHVRFSGYAFFCSYMGKGLRASPGISPMGGTCFLLLSVKKNA